METILITTNQMKENNMFKMLAIIFTAATYSFNINSSELTPISTYDFAYFMPILPEARCFKFSKLSSNDITYEFIDKLKDVESAYYEMGWGNNDKRKALRTLKLLMLVQSAITSEKEANTIRKMNVKEREDWANLHLYDYLQQQGKYQRAIEFDHNLRSCEKKNSNDSCNNILTKDEIMNLIKTIRKDVLSKIPVIPIYTGDNEYKYKYVKDAKKLISKYTCP